MSQTAATTRHLSRTHHHIMRMATILQKFQPTEIVIILIWPLITILNTAAVVIMSEDRQPKMHAENLHLIGLKPALVNVLRKF